MINFESGRIDQQWKKQQTRDGFASSLHIPSNISVIYPLKIDEREIYNQSGIREGLRINVNIPLMRVSGAYGITTQNYESSLYETETDFEKLVDVAENGGSIYPIPLLEQENNQQETVALRLGTPTFSYIKHWHFIGKETQELIAPALIFTIINATEKGYYQENIVVPIIKDLLRQNY